jgi:hypothetical protein
VGSEAQEGKEDLSPASAPKNQEHPLSEVRLQFTDCAPNISCISPLLAGICSTAETMAHPVEVHALEDAIKVTHLRLIYG